VTVSRIAGVLVVFVLLLASGCGSGSKKESEEGGGAEKECGPAAAAMGGSPTLPPKFPTPASVTYTGQTKAGPSSIVKGFRDGELDEAFDSYKSAFGSAGYSITDSEKEEDDAEVNFQGGKSTGQVKMIQLCKDRTSLSITIRPE
jgi:hypothetical protein